MAKYCPIVEKRVVYLVCQECEDKMCFQKPMQQNNDAKTSNSNEKEKNNVKSKSL